MTVAELKAKVIWAWKNGVLIFGDNGKVKLRKWNEPPPEVLVFIKSIGKYKDIIIQAAGAAREDIITDYSVPIIKDAYGEILFMEGRVDVVDGDGVFSLTDSPASIRECAGWWFDRLFMKGE